MNNQLLITIGSEKHTAFLQDGFYSGCTFTTSLHSHNYPEIHVIATGKVTFNIGDKLHTFVGGNILVIPKGVYHYSVYADENTVHTAFQTDCNIEEFSECKISRETLSDFIKESSSCTESTDYSKISSYISLFCSYFYTCSRLEATPITDYGFLIREFFVSNYSKNIHLCDLAQLLHLSERQTERLVIEHTGNSFGKELGNIRMTMAKKLLKSSEKSLGEICSHVGYRSYAGFWKAMKKHGLNLYDN